jgi:hypothetical protein
VGDDVHINNEALLVTDFVNLKIKLAQSFKCASRSRIRVCVHRGECSYVYEYLSLYYVLKKKSFTGNETSSIEIYLPIDSLG